MSDIDWDLIMTDSDTANELIQLKYSLIQSEIKLDEQAELIEKLQADVARYKPDYDRYSVLLYDAWMSYCLKERI